MLRDLPKWEGSWLRGWNFNVVARGPSLHDENSYYVIRRYESLSQREQMEDAYYASDDWRKSPRKALLALIESRFARILSLSWMKSWSMGCGNKAKYQVVSKRLYLMVSFTHP